MINLRNVKDFCKDDYTKIENYDKAIADREHCWVCHHRLELTLDGEFANYPEDLKRFGMYYNRPYFELIFIPQGEHTTMHNKGRSPAARANQKKKMTGKKMPPEVGKKISETKLSQHRKHTPEARAKMSKSQKGRPAWNKGLKMKKKVAIP